MKKLLLLTLSAFCFSFLCAQNPYDNQKTATGEIYRAVYHKISTNFPSNGLVQTQIYHKIREEIDGSQSVFYYELYYSPENPAKTRIKAEDLRNIITALEQIYKDYQSEKDGESMYFAKNGFTIGYDTSYYRKHWKISLSKDDGFTDLKADNIPEIISAFKTALAEMEKLSK